jgi:hypothetical protein
VKRCVLALVAAVATTSCTLFLDFDLDDAPAGDAQTSRPREGGGAADASLDAAVDVADAAMDADVYVPPPFGPLVCPALSRLCTGFELQTDVLAAPFTRDLRGTSAATLVTNAVGSGLQSLSFSTATSATAETQQLAAEGLIAGANRAFDLRALIWLDHADGAFVGGATRTLIVVRPYATIDQAGLARVELIANAAGVRVVIKRFDAQQELAYQLGFARRVWHDVEITGRFDDNNGRVSLRVDGNVLGVPGPQNVDTVPPGGVDAQLSVSVGVSGSAGAPPAVVRFDNVTLTTN